MAKNRVIGRDGKIPWHISDDLKRFKALTMGHPVVMGRKTYESIGRALPGRTNIVLSRNAEFSPPDAVTVPSLKEALDVAKGGGAASEGGEPLASLASRSGRPEGREVFVIGGQSLYEQALPVADRIYLTLVDVKVEGDAFFPEIDEGRWEIASSEKHEKDEKNPIGYSYLIYKKKK